MWFSEKKLSQTRERRKKKIVFMLLVLLPFCALRPGTKRLKRGNMK
jgi:accessory gene regulator protein AgrB